MLFKLIPVLILSLALSSSVVQGLPNRRITHVRGQKSSIFAASNGGSKNNAKGNNQSNNQNDPQTSTTLDPRVIQLASNTDGQNNLTEPSQTPSDKSPNNFINFCIGKGPLTNGTQNQNGSCNQTPMGQIVSSDKVPSTKFQNPKNLATVKANETFTITLAVQNMEMGQFTNPDTTYFAAPAKTNQQGQYQGHSHVVLENIDSLSSTKLTNPTKFQFFKGLNGGLDKDGTISTNVTGGIPPGTYRLSSLTTSQNHQCINGPRAQRGVVDDAVYITATVDGKPAASGTATGDNNKNQDTKSSSSSSKGQVDTTNKSQNTTSSSTNDTTNKSQDTTSSSSNDQVDTKNKSQDTKSSSANDQVDTKNKSQDTKSSSSNDQVNTTDKSQNTKSNSQDTSNDESCPAENATS